eukprot:826625-Pleurochrysis_carterae.AAC.5
MRNGRLRSDCLASQAGCAPLSAYLLDAQRDAATLGALRVPAHVLERYAPALDLVRTRARPRAARWFGGSVLRCAHDKEVCLLVCIGVDGFTACDISIPLTAVTAPARTRNVIVESRFACGN